MNKLIIASHGKLAEGVKSSLNVLGIDTDKISFVNCYVDDNDAKEHIAKCIEESKEETMIVLTDLLGGSVNTEFMQYLQKDNLYIVAGFNFGLVLQLLMIPEDADINEYLRNAVNEAKEGIVFINDLSFDNDDLDE